MRLFGFDIRRAERQGEERASVESPSVPISSEAILRVFGIEADLSAEPVSVEMALKDPAIWCAVNFLAGTLATLPLGVYGRDRENNRTKLKGAVANMLAGRVNPGLSCFEWRKRGFEQVLTEGRWLTFIERNARGMPLALWPMSVRDTRIERRDGRVIYLHSDGTATRPYEASQVIDLAYMLHADGLRHRVPAIQCAEAVRAARGAAQYAARFYRRGGVPPFAVEGGFESAGGVERAGRDIMAAVQNAARRGDAVMPLPSGHKIHALGVDPEKAQNIEGQRFSVEQAARIYQLPPVFLHDLTRGTFANAEQQGSTLVRHTLLRWTEQLEAELALKLFRATGGVSRHIEHDFNRLQRGDYASRMAGHAAAINAAVRMPDEVRAEENLPAAPGGNRLYIQSGTVPVTSLPDTVEGADSEEGESNG